MKVFQFPESGSIAPNCRAHSLRLGLTAPPAFGITANRRTRDDGRPFSRSFVLSSPGRLRPEQIGGFTLQSPQGLHPLSTPGHCDLFPLLCELDLLPSTLWPANRNSDQEDNRQRASASYPSFSSGQTHGFPFQSETISWHSKSHQRSLRIPPTEYPYRSHRAETRFPEIDSTNLAYRASTPSRSLVFNPDASLHGEEGKLLDQARKLEVIQESDFRTKITIRKKASFSSCPSRVRRGSGFFQKTIRLFCGNQSISEILNQY